MPRPVTSSVPAQAVAVDHCFFIVARDDLEPLVRRLGSAGLAPTPPHRHLGQGTANLFYCFDNAFLEILWIEDEAAASGPASRRIGLAQRAAWRRTAACPIGVALRTRPAAAPLPFPTWRYVPDPRTGMKPTDAAEPDAELRQPFLFRGQRSEPPAQWTDGRAGARQTLGGFADVVRWAVLLAEPTAPGGALSALERLGLVDVGSAPAPELHLTASRADGGPARRFVLPTGAFHDEA